MSTKDYIGKEIKEVPPADGMRIGIVVSDWNFEVTSELEKGAVETLLGHGATLENIKVCHVPGSFELPLGGQLMVETHTFDAVILLGCVIQGETRHFDFVCQGVTQGTMDLNLKYNIPFLFGILTTDNQQQALDRAGGKLGNKGAEAALAAIRMVSLKRTL
jgi:6,7-dimethyl-8-ribityllumazine synthase